MRARSLGLGLLLHISVCVHQPVHGRPGQKATLNQLGATGLLESPRATLLGPGQYAFGAWFNYFYSDGAQAFRASPFSVGLGLPHKMDFALAFSNTDGADPLARSREVQLHSMIKRELLSTEEGSWVTAAALKVENMLSRPDLSPLLLADHLIGKTSLVALVGYRFATDTEDSYSGLRGGLGLERRVWKRFVVQAESRVDYSADRGLSVGFSGSLRWRVQRNLDIVFGVSGGLNQEARVRFVVGLCSRPVGGGREDSDEDGIPDTADACPEEPEDRDGYEDDDGCPEPQEGPAREEGLHRGPVLMRMRIPLQPIPVWIMKRRAPSASEEMIPRIELRLPRWAVDPPSVIGTTVGERLKLLTPGWAERRSSVVGESVGAPLQLHQPTWAEDASP